MNRKDRWMLVMLVLAAMVMSVSVNAQTDLEQKMSSRISTPGSNTLACILASAAGRGIGMAAGLTESTAGLGAVGGYRDLARYTTLGGALFVFALPVETVAKATTTAIARR